MKRDCSLLSPPVHGGSAERSEAKGAFAFTPSDRFAATSPVNGGGKAKCDA